MTTVATTTRDAPTANRQGRPPSRPTRGRTVPDVKTVHRPAPDPSPVLLSPPWWAAAPTVASLCATLALLPFRALAVVAETVLAVATLALVGGVAAWYVGWLDDATVAQALRPVGERLLAIATDALEPR